MLELPRSARLAAWGTAALLGEVGTAEAVAAVTGDDEPHQVSAGPDGSTDLVELLAGLRRRGVRGLRLVLPAPGDPLGLPGPAAFNTEAVDAGECVLAEPASTDASLDASPIDTQIDSGFALLPRVELFGSSWEPGARVTWTWHPTEPRRTTDPTSLAEADRTLREALAEATAALAALDVARWREDATGRIAAVRDGALGPRVLPPGVSARAVRVLGMAARVRAVVELAIEDDGAAVSGWEASRRAEALRGLEAVARRGMAAAVNAPLERD